MNKTIFWVGAGVSIPSKMPSGKDLTLSWLQHFLPDKYFQEIEKIFIDNEHIFGRAFPRLEKIIDDTVSICGNECLKELLFFKDIVPNEFHHIISKVTTENDGIIITTNFDDGLEKVNANLPIYRSEIDGINSYGLYKIHGCISIPPENWGITINNIQNGLPEKLQIFLETILDNPNNTIYVLGYSASDYFDIVPMFEKRRRLEKYYKAKIVWFEFAPTTNISKYINSKSMVDNLPPNPIKMLKAFHPENITIYKGDSLYQLKKIFSVLTNFEENQEINYNWKHNTFKSMNITNRTKNILAAKFLSSLGFGNKTLQIIRNINGFVRNEELYQLYLNALRDAGFYKSEYYNRKKITNLKSNILKPLFLQRQLSASQRLSNHLFLAFKSYAKILKKTKNIDEILAYKDNDNFIWYVAEAGLFMQSILYRIPRNLVIIILSLPIEIYLRNKIGECLKFYKKFEIKYKFDKSPHLLATFLRINEYLNNPICRIKKLNILVRIFDKYSKECFEFGDMSGNLYTETDSLLGWVNNTRNEALSGFRQLDMFHSTSNNIMIEYISSALVESFESAKYLKDIPGQYKALKLLGDVSKLINQNKIAKDFYRESKRLKKLLNKADRSYLKKFGAKETYQKHINNHSNN